jgi:hypothetical protein
VSISVEGNATFPFSGAAIAEFMICMHGRAMLSEIKILITWIYLPGTKIHSTLHAYLYNAPLCLSIKETQDFPSRLERILPSF